MAAWAAMLATGKPLVKLPAMLNATAVVAVINPAFSACPRSPEARPATTAEEMIAAAMGEQAPNVPAVQIAAAATCRIFPRIGVRLSAAPSALNGACHKQPAKQ